MLLNSYNNDYNQTHFIFSIFVSMFRASLFVSNLCDLFLIFSVIFIFINYITSHKQTYLFFVPFLFFLQNCFWMTTQLKKLNNFRIPKVQPLGAAQFLLGFFCQFQLGVAYGSVVYKKMQRKSFCLSMTLHYIIRQKNIF